MSEVQTIDDEILEILGNKRMTAGEVYNISTSGVRAGPMIDAMRRMAKGGSLQCARTGRKVCMNCQPQMEYWV